MLLNIKVYPIIYYLDVKPRFLQNLPLKLNKVFDETKLKKQRIELKVVWIIKINLEVLILPS